MLFRVLSFNGVVILHLPAQAGYGYLTVFLSLDLWHIFRHVAPADYLQTVVKRLLFF